MQAMAVTIKLADYNVSPVTGFIPVRAPAPLSGEHFSQWERVLKDLPHLIAAKKLRREVDSLPELDCSDSALKSEDEWIRAYTMLCFIGQGYIWMEGKEGLVDILPKKLAVPWVAVSERIGVNPNINYAASVLYNFQLRDPAGPIDMNNLHTIQSFTGTESECWFFMAHVCVEVAAGPGLDAMVCAFQHMANDDHSSLCKSLKAVKSSMKKMEDEARQMYKGCEPNTFYVKIRPFVSGSRDLPNGLIYEGVDLEPRRYRGASGAQTSSVYAFDIFLGTEHSDEGRREFVTEMRAYMPKIHRSFLEKLDRMPSIREYCKRSGNQELISCYNNAVEALLSFRKRHITLVKSYITNPSLKYNTPAETGSAGTYFKDFLGGIRNDTDKLKL